MSKLKHVLVVLTVAAISSAAGFWLDQHPPRVTIINPARPPVPILEPADVEKIRTLQNAKEIFLLGGISPDAILTRDDCRMQ